MTKNGEKEERKARKIDAGGERDEVKNGRRRWRLRNLFEE